MDMVVGSLHKNLAIKKTGLFLRLLSRVSLRIRSLPITRNWSFQQDICYPDVREVIKQLAKTYDLYIVSNCQCGYIEQFLRKTQLEAYIKDIECFGNTGKNKGENIRLLVKRNSLKAPVYIGDTKGDCDASKEAGVPFIFASYGFGNVIEYEYAAKIGEMKDLLTLFSGQ